MTQISTDPIAQALGLSDKDIEGIDNKTFDPLIDLDRSFFGRAFRHEKEPKTYYVRRDDCIRAMYRTGAKKMQAFFRHEWIPAELLEYEKEEMRRIGMIDMLKNRHLRRNL